MKGREMKRMQEMVVAGAFAWLLAVAASSGAAEPAAENPPVDLVPAWTEAAEIVVELTYSPEVLPLGEAGLSGLWNGAAIRRQAVEAVFGAASDRRSYADRVRFEVAPLLPIAAGAAPAGGLARNVGLSVRARFVATRPGVESLETSRRLLEQATPAVQELLRQAHSRNIENLSARLDQAEDAWGAALAKREAVMARQRELVREGGWGSLDRAVLSQTLHGLRRQQQEIGIEAAVTQVRREAIQKEIARMADDAARAQAESPVAAQLERVLSLRREALDRVRRLFETGRIAESEVAEAQEACLLAEIELEKHRSGMAGQGGVSEQLVALNAQLSEATIKTAELEVRSRMLEEAANRIESLFSLVDEYERHEIEARDLATAVEEAGRLRDQLADRLRGAVEPSLRIVGESVAGAQPRPAEAATE